MKTKRTLVIGRSIAVFYCLFATVLSFSAGFENLPGTRAKGMAGAFVAVADDMACFWYNPAGYGIPFNRGMLVESGQATEKKYFGDETDQIIAGGMGGEYRYSNSGSDVFIGMSFGKYGVYYGKPYKMNWYFSPYRQEFGIGQLFGTVREDVSVLGVVRGFELVKDVLYVGASLELVTVNFGESTVFRINSIDSDGTAHARLINVSDDYDLKNSVSGSVGFLWRLYQSENQLFEIKLGGVYRFTSSSIGEEGYGLEEGGVLFEKPSSYAVGLSLQRAFENAVVIFSSQYERTDWGEANHAFQNVYEKVAIGGDFQVPFGNNKMVALRLGWYDCTASYRGEGWPDIRAFTYGIGVTLNDIWALELAGESQEIDDPSGLNENDTLDVFSFGLVLHF